MLTYTRARGTLQLVAAAFLFASTLRFATAFPLNESARNPHPPSRQGRSGSSSVESFALTAATGPSLAWRHKCDSAVEADGVFADDGTFYVGCLGGLLYAIHPVSGRRMWQFDAAGAIFAAPVVAADGR